MKKFAIGFAAFLFVLFALRPPSATGQQGIPTAFSQALITNGHTVSTNFFATNLKVMKVTLVGLKSAGVSNTADVFIGPISNTVYNIAPGTCHIIETQPNSFIFLNQWWLRTPTAGDGVTVIYQ